MTSETAAPGLQAAGAVPNAAPPPLPQSLENQRQEMDDEKEDDGKVSRWQIGSSSLSVLEAVYQMEPFPGACRLTPDGTLKGLPLASTLLPPACRPSRRRAARLPSKGRKQRRTDFTACLGYWSWLVASHKKALNLSHANMGGFATEYLSCCADTI